MNLSRQMREYFVSDNGLPIQVLDDPYFEYYLELLDPYYQSVEKHELLLDILSKLGEEIFHKSVKSFRDTMIHFVEESPYYQNFVYDMRMPDPVVPLNKGNLYQINNVGRQFVSIDLVEANFQSLKYACPLLLEKWETYQEFAKNFTNIEYLIKCKKIRQIIFGQLCPQRQQTIQRYIVSEIKNYLMDTWGVKWNDFITTSSDEMVFETFRSVPEITLAIGNMEGSILKLLIPEVKDIRIRIKIFKLLSEGTPKFNFFTKLYENGHKDIKQVDSAYLPEVIKYLEGKEVNPDLDRLFIKDGRLCQFKDPLF